MLLLVLAKRKFQKTPEKASVSVQKGSSQGGRQSCKLSNRIKERVEMNDQSRSELFFKEMGWHLSENN